MTEQREGFRGWRLCTFAAGEVAVVQQGTESRVQRVVFDTLLITVRRSEHTRCSLLIKNTGRASG